MTPKVHLRRKGVMKPGLEFVRTATVGTVYFRNGEAHYRDEIAQALINEGFAERVGGSGVLIVPASAPVPPPPFLRNR